MFEVSNVSTRHFMITVVCGASVMLAGALFKLIPNKWIEDRMPALDESKSIGSENRFSAGLMKAYENQSNAKAF